MNTLTEFGRGSLLTGTVLMGGFTYLFYRSSLRAQEESGKLYRYLTTSVSLITFFYYLLLTSASFSETPFSIPFDITTLTYVHWGTTTPLLLICIANLESFSVSETYYIVSLDLLMLVSGYCAHIALDPIVFWPLYLFGVCCYGILMRTLSLKTFKFYDQVITISNINNKLFTSLVLLIGGFWTLYPILFIVRHLCKVNINTIICINVCLDIFVKGVFGVLLIGGKEVMEGIDSSIATFSKSIIRVHPTTLEPVKEGDIQVVEPRRQAKRASIYIYTPPSSQNTIINVQQYPSTRSLTDTVGSGTFLMNRPLGSDTPQ